MKVQAVMVAVAGSLALSGAALAQGGMGMGMMDDGDAKITKEQFVKKAEMHFAHMDGNKDGVIDASDRQKMRERMHKCMGMDGMSGGMEKDGAPHHGSHRPPPAAQ
jgi:hypothetical protein